MAGELKEKCAVAGVLAGEEDAAAAAVYETLFALQHRGTEATGMASQLPSGEIGYHFAPGMVRDVYDDKAVANRLSDGNPVIGHNRYSTSGSKQKHPQPVVDATVGLALGHNGNLPYADKLASFLGSRHMRYQQFNDSEMMGHAIAQVLREGKTLPDAIEETYPLFTGAFSCVASQDGALAAFRDPYGIRPLAMGSLKDGGTVFSSETCGLDMIGAKYQREVRPGELVVATPDGIESRQLAEGVAKLDMFEMVYFARHDSRLYGQSVNEVRRGFGKQLAIEHGSPYDDTDNTLVIPVPDTSVPGAEGYANELGLDMRQLIIKNRYIGRTFMLTTVKDRQEQLRYKHSIIDEGVRGKNLILIDDSIVRLNTMPRIVKMARAAGARAVSVLVHSPPVRFPDFYGIDTPTQGELAAANMTVEQMRQEIDCDYLGFLSLSGMVKATGVPADNFNLSCFTGEYPIDIGQRKREIGSPVSMQYVE